MFLKHLSILIIAVSLSSCNSSGDTDRDWIETEALITLEEPSKEPAEYWYTIQYEASKSTAVTKEGKPINGTFKQHALEKKKPIQGQKLKIKYMKEEPIIFKLLEPIRYEV